MGVDGKEVVGLYPLRVLFDDGSEVEMGHWTQTAKMYSRMLPWVCLEHMDGTASGLVALNKSNMMLRFSGGSCAQGFKENQVTVYCQSGFSSCPQSHEWHDGLHRRLQVASMSIRSTS